MNMFMELGRYGMLQLFLMIMTKVTVFLPP